MADENRTSLTLLDGLRAGDNAAWQRLSALYTPLVEYWCRLGGVFGADADDVRQEVFQAVVTRIETFRREHASDSFRGWLRGITRHKVMDHYRRKHDQPQGAGGTAAQEHLARLAETIGTDDAGDPSELVQELYRRALEVVRSEFEEPTWKAFQGAVIDGRPTADVAAELGVTPAAIRKSKSRVLARLRAELGESPQASAGE